MNVKVFWDPTWCEITCEERRSIFEDTLWLTVSLIGDISELWSVWNVNEFGWYLCHWMSLVFHDFSDLCRFLAIFINCGQIGENNLLYVSLAGPVCSRHLSSSRIPLDVSSCLPLNRFIYGKKLVEMGYLLVFPTVQHTQCAIDYNSGIQQSMLERSTTLGSVVRWTCKPSSRGLIHFM